MHSVTVSTFDLTTGTRHRVSSKKDVTYPMTDCRAEPCGLYFRVTSDASQGTDWHTMQAYVLPELHLQVVVMEWREEGYAYDYCLDDAHDVETGQHWVVRDLYLDILVYEKQKLAVLDTDEYLAAIAEGHLDKEEAEHALTVTHDTLNALSKYGNSLEAYLEARGIHLEWI